MYSKEETTKLQKETEQLLRDLEKSKLNDSGVQQISEKKIEGVRKVLRFHEYRYYILNDPLVSDFEYDQLFKALEKIEKGNPSLISIDSPTQRVAKGLAKDFPTVQHLVPMLSLDNSYNSEDLVDFDRRARELTAKDKIEYCVEPKFDGASISLIYEDDFLARGATRGDGVQGDDITINIKQIRSIPLSAKFSKYGIQQIEIRGEVLINKNNFKKFNEQLMEQGIAPLANPRNAASGTLRIKDPSEVKKRCLEAFVYNMSDYTLRTGKQLPKEFQVGRTGSITPVAKIQPVPIGGVTVGSISLFNEDIIRDKDLMIGDAVLVERAGDVIPYIVKSLPDIRTGNEMKIHFPKTCPVCGSK